MRSRTNSPCAASDGSARETMSRSARRNRALVASKVVIWVCTRNHVALRDAARPRARGFQGGIVIRVCTCACRVPWRMSLVLLCTTPIVRVCHWPVRLMNPGATIPKRFALPSPLRWCPPRPAQTLAPPPPRSASSTLHSQRPGSVFAH